MLQSLSQEQILKSKIRTVQMRKAATYLGAVFVVLTTFRFSMESAALLEAYRSYTLALSLVCFASLMLFIKEYKFLKTYGPPDIKHRGISLITMILTAGLGSIFL